MPVTMSAHPQWDIKRALRVARLFHFVCGVRTACVTPFLTLYLSQLGLTAPLVGIIMGIKHLIAAFWAPFGASLAKSFQKRRLVLLGSLLGSVGTSPLMILIPYVGKELEASSCNAVHKVASTISPLGAAFMGNSTWAPKSTSNLITWVPSLAAQGEMVETSSIQKGLANSSVQESSYFVDSTEEARNTSQILQAITSGVKEVTWQGALKMGSSKTPLPTMRRAPTNTTILAATGQYTGALNISVEELRWAFIFALCFMVLWEMVAAPLDQVADDSLYEYLDFVDATYGYRSLWIWRLLGMSVGVCSTAALVGQLDCFLRSQGPSGVVYFYSYALVSILALLVSIVFPIPVFKQWEPSNKTLKALSLIGNSPHLILLAFTVVLVGATNSIVQNYLFWYMKKFGSSELVMGFSVALSLLGEILLYPLKNILLRNLSRMGTVGLGLVCLAGQLLYYAFTWTWWSVLPVQILSAISNGAFWWAVKASIEDMSTSITERTLITMFQSHFYGGGCSLGSFLGGFVMMRFDLPLLFQFCTIILMIWLIFFLSILMKLPREHKISYSKLLVVEANDTSDSEQGTEQDWLVKAMKDDHFEWKG